MTLDVVEIKKIAHLARLSISDKSASELNSIAEDLNKIFKWVDQMQAVDTSNITPMAHPLDTKLRARADNVTSENDIANNQKSAPLVEHGLYLIPQVIE